MEIHTNIPLKNYTTMKLGGPARFMTNITKKDDIPQLITHAQQNHLPIVVLGGGSNTVVKDEGFNGIVLHMRIAGITVIKDTLNHTTLTVGAGVIWDDLVKYSVDARLSGIEAMSAIPGTVGAAPVQNIGAYGQELADTFVSLEAYDIESHKFITLNRADCQFSYRFSIFRGESFGRYIITSVTLRLSKNMPSPPFYASLQQYFDEHDITTYTHQTVRDAVIKVRQTKLPDPSKIANSGSFFKNPIIEDWLFRELSEKFPDLPHYEMPDNHHKIPAGWLIEKTGLKGSLIEGMRIYQHNALVLINESATAYHNLDEARNRVITAVRDMFRISLEQEPLEI